MLIGYMRPFHDDLECKSQLKQLREENCEQIVVEAHLSAKKRVKLEEMIQQLHPGDQIVVAKLYSLADSTRHLLELLNEIGEKGAYVKTLKEGIDTNDKEKYSFTYIVERLVEFQSDVISEKTKKGLNKAKEKGVVAGRPRKPDENVQRAIAMYESRKYSLKEIREETGISKSTLYRYLES